MRPVCCEGKELPMDVRTGGGRAMPVPTPPAPGSTAEITFAPSGVEPGRVTALSCGGLDWRAVELQWTTEPGSVGLEFDRPALLFCTEEVGGRCQVRLAAGRPP